MKQIRAIATIAFIILAALAIIFITSMKKTTNYNDGTWVGEGNGFKGPIVIEVTTQDNKIISAKLIEKSDSDFALPTIDTIIAKTIEKNSISNVDSISGATYTSKGTIEAITNALNQAKK